MEQAWYMYTEARSQLLQPKTGIIWNTQCHAGHKFNYSVCYDYGFDPALVFNIQCYPMTGSTSAEQLSPGKKILIPAQVCNLRQFHI